MTVSTNPLILYPCWKSALLRKHDRTRISEYEIERFGNSFGPTDGHTPADQGALDATWEVEDGAVGKDDRVFDFGVTDLTVRIDCGEGSDEAVLDQAVLADHNWSPNGAVDDSRPFPDRDAAFDTGILAGPVVDRFDVFEDQAVGIEHRLHGSGVFPPAFNDMGPNGEAAVDQSLDGVCDLEFATGAWFESRDAIVDAFVEEVDADEG